MFAYYSSTKFYFYAPEHVIKNGYIFRIFYCTLNRFVVLNLAQDVTISPKVIWSVVGPEEIRSE